MRAVMKALPSTLRAAQRICEGGGGGGGGGGGVVKVLHTSSYIVQWFPHASLFSLMDTMAPQGMGEGCSCSRVSTVQRLQPSPPALGCHCVQSALPYPPHLGCHCFHGCPYLYPTPTAPPPPHLGCHCVHERPAQVGSGGVEAEEGRIVRSHDRTPHSLGREGGGG